MPLTAKGNEIKAALVKEYGEKKGENVLYAGKNSGKFTGIDSMSMNTPGFGALADAVDKLNRGVDSIGQRMDALGRKDMDAGGAGQGGTRKRLYPAYSDKELEKFVAEGVTPNRPQQTVDKMKEELAARKSGASKPYVVPQIGGGKPQTKVGRM